MTFAASDANDELLGLYLRQWRTLRLRLTRRTGSRELAEDALQETWLRLAGLKQSAPAVRDGQAFILHVASNIAIDLSRQDLRHSARRVHDEDALLSAVDPAPSPETVTIDRDRLRALVRALGELPPKPRAALLMCRYDGLSHAEIAAALAVSESMVAKYLAQALRHCRDRFRAVA
ncbi:RNA polymerase sigma factor [Methylopila sp. 73B]|uniref:RNA polymerase sigma factor n=1 Tax=Methylopila sp. 73B TaxID=1120792 RepID=UPI00036496EA|nr:RNA polymerase sigma factor [Methylopila sp. 73B]